MMRPPDEQEDPLTREIKGKAIAIHRALKRRSLSKNPYSSAFSAPSAVNRFRFDAFASNPVW
jgi:hypothetical protein